MDYTNIIDSSYENEFPVGTILRVTSPCVLYHVDLRGQIELGKYQKFECDASLQILTASDIFFDGVLTPGYSVSNGIELEEFFIPQSLSETHFEVVQT